jgi:hypothetical protein
LLTTIRNKRNKMKKKLLLSIALVSASAFVYFIGFQNTEVDQTKKFSQKDDVKKKKKTPEERMLFVNERLEYEFNLQKNPSTGEIPFEKKQLEYENALVARDLALNSRTTSSTYVSRGPTNLGGRTRAFVIDRTDNTSNTILAGGVSSGLFRTTDGGASWTKVSANDEIHNVTAIAQDPRSGFENIWYYATGERSGNSASLGSFLFGNGVWQSTDGGLTWNQIPETASVFTSFDSRLDLISSIEVSPINGDLLIGAVARIYRWDGTSLTTELDQASSPGSTNTDVEITSSGRVYVTIDGAETNGGVWTSPTGNGDWTRIARNGSPSGWFAAGRIVLGAAPSNDDVIYALYENGNSGSIEADLWQYDFGDNKWTNYSSTLPDEPGGNLSGNDPFAIQGGYDLVVSVKPDDENYLVIGGTNVYKIADVTTDPEFERIGGYNSNVNYALYEMGGDTHHPDIHALEFDPNNTSILFSGTDGGVHRTNDVTASTVTWVNLNNNYQTYQYYHVALDPDGSNAVIGGAQDNGTTIGGTDLGAANDTDMSTWFGGDGVAVGIAQRNGGTDYQFYYGTQNGNMRTNFPTCCRGIAPNGASSQFVTYFYLDPDNTNFLYYAGQTRLYKTNDAINVTSATWDNLGTLPINQNIQSVAASRGNYDSASSYLLIGGQNGGIFRLDDPASATDLTGAVNITPSGASTANGTVVSGLAIHPTNPDIVMAVYANYGIQSIFITSDATASNPTWTLVERNLSEHSIRSAAIAELSGETIYFVGTARGLYSSNDPVNVDWDLEGVDQIGLAVVSGLVYRPSDNKLLIGTHGNGMFETTVEGTLSNEDVVAGELGLRLYPNPTVSELNLRLSDIDLSDEVSYRISDLTGKLVMEGVAQNRKVNVESLVAGVYIINLKVDGKTQSSKFIKN